MKMLLVDDHPLVRSALESVILSMGREITVLGAGSAAQAHQCLAEAGAVDLVLLDLHLPDANGFSLMAEWRESHPQMRVLIVSACEDMGEVMRALESGAAGFIPKRTALEVLVHALRLVLSGGIYVPPVALKQAPAPMVQTSARSAAAPIKLHEPALGAASAGLSLQSVWWPGAAPSEAAAAPMGVGARSASLPHQLRLTPRQSEVLSLLLQGQPNKLIARQLNLSVETVKDHVASLLRVLGVSSRTQAVLAASQLMAAASSGGQPAMRPPAPTLAHRPV
jgi:DNA-binding NarL/FixJ family response regulator